MENSGDEYLHKKFKKQLSVEPKNQHADKDRRSPIRKMSITDASPYLYNQDTSASDNLIKFEISNFRTSKESNDIVPKLSTKFNVNVLDSFKVDKSSISEVVALSERDENNAIRDVNWNSEKCKQGGKMVDPQSFNNCISYVTSKSSRIGNSVQPEVPVKPVNFDIKFKPSEPSGSSIPAAETSSILDNVYSKQSYVISKLVNVETSGDISSNSSLEKDHLSHTNESNTLENRTLDIKVDFNSTQESGTAEKAPGGKYVCSYCNLACSKPSVLQKHIRAHTNERPYPCVSCGFSFKTRSNLYKHCRSRTHANRVMGNKAQEINNEVDIDSQSKGEYTEQNSPVELANDEGSNKITEKAELQLFLGDESTACDKRNMQDAKSKPYKPRFHTAKAFFDTISKENRKDIESDQTIDIPYNRPTNSDLLSLHINEVINKNNAIINSNESYLFKKRSIDNCIVDNSNNNESSHRFSDTVFSPMHHMISEEKHADEPLNLTNKNRKRCMSEVAEPVIQKSLIKELLLKNLYADSNMQCPYCKMIFQTVTELELHKMRSCKGFTKSGARYSRSSSVNVASILTQNKNAFDNIPHLKNTTFPLKSPGPFLGKTRLVESDKAKSYSFDDGLPSFPNLLSPNDILKVSRGYAISPLTVQFDKIKKTPVKLFGGEVKITHTSGETKSFKIDGKDTDMYGDDSKFLEYGGKLSENRVVKSSLQSGGTVLQNKPNYNAKQDLRTSPDVIRVYENTSVSPSIDIANLEKTKFSFERQISEPSCTFPSSANELKLSASEILIRPASDVTGSSNFSIVSPSYKYTNIMDFSQNAVRQLAPNLKQPNLTVPGVPIPNKLTLTHSSSLILENKIDSPKIFDLSSVKRTSGESSRAGILSLSNSSRDMDTEKRHIENMKFAEKQIMLQQRMDSSHNSQAQSPSMFNPVNLLVNGKVVRYVPGMPGPVAADVAMDIGYSSNVTTTHRPPLSNLRLHKANLKNQLVNQSSYMNITKSQVILENNLSLTSNIDEKKNTLNNAYLHVDKKLADTGIRSPKLDPLEIKTNELLVPNTPEAKSPNTKARELRSPTSKAHENKSPTAFTPNSSSIENPRKFARPNTLALKPSISSLKQHHGLTPTMFNQILISPDTPRVAKKYNQHFLHGNYFSYLGLKSSTKSVYCTLNKTQPFYVPHFKKLSMYSEWRQQDNKTDKLYLTSYDSRQKQQQFTTAGRGAADMVVRSSYKFVATDISFGKGEEQAKSNAILGGYESNEDYTYIRGRGRGRYVCDQCGIRCKKPSMLKKHIRTHTNDRPFTCSHCNFSFKTKGNLTKHMKSKAHTKNYAASSSSNSSTQQSGTQSSDSDTEDSGMDSSDESTRQQEHEAAYGLLSLSQKTTSNMMPSSHTETINFSSSPACCRSSPTPTLSATAIENTNSFMNTEQITQVNNTNFVKNKILDQQVNISFSAPKILNETNMCVESSSKETQNLTQFLGKSNTNMPLTYPYTSVLNLENQPKTKTKENIGNSSNVLQENTPKLTLEKVEQRNITQFSVIQKYNVQTKPEVSSSKHYESKKSPLLIITPEINKHLEINTPSIEQPTSPHKVMSPLAVKISERAVINETAFSSVVSEIRKRKLSINDDTFRTKLHRDSEVMDLSMPSSAEKNANIEINCLKYNGTLPTKQNDSIVRISYSVSETCNSTNSPIKNVTVDSKSNITRHSEHKIDDASLKESLTSCITDKLKLSFKTSNDDNFKQKNELQIKNEIKYKNNENMYRNKESSIHVKPLVMQHSEDSNLNINYVIQENHPIIAPFNESPKNFKSMEYDNSAMETLADVATKQVKLEKNTLAKSVASEYLKLATKNEFSSNDNLREANNFVASNKDVNELIVKPEENKSCTICSKNFSKPSQLRLHMNIHYLERPFRCDSCSVSFRTKGHLQKHERSASHHNKLSSSPALSSSEPRPFKCSDCNIAFRIHGHLAKHLRSKMHIMKLECLAKIPFGLYAELERANSLLTEINTSDGDQCLESLKVLAKKVFINDPSKLNQLVASSNIMETDS